MRYLLDTNAVIGLMGGAPAILSRVRWKHPSDLCVSAITIHELYFGAYKGARTNETIERLTHLELDVVPLDREDAMRAGEIRAYLGRAGTPIGVPDALIAGQAISRDFTLVTRNLREFRRVLDLRLEDWEA
ncbi:pilus assembly protein [Devosia geojensis]|uniref:Ribonuclease VapC n=1 Tax=Devosia geojensis TaxID=443610 RepID=A0A0F5FX64_9HYPH|nr:type II toxin-antitoxin system VapC family toxin [Devosia geojensis]KKB13444.1 pilus assembly protein [Devosia geojensis]